MINFDFLGVPSELQIHLESKYIRDKPNNDFSHLIYELTRSPYGITAECAKMLCKYDKFIVRSSKDIYKDELSAQLNRI
jgi:hypothetical protein